MNLKPYIPTAPQVIREGIIVLAGLLIASFVLSRFPDLQKFVNGNSITVRDQNDNVLF